MSEKKEQPARLPRFAAAFDSIERLADTLGRGVLLSVSELGGLAFPAYCGASSLCVFRSAHLPWMPQVWLWGIDRFDSDSLIGGARNRFTFDQPKMARREFPSAMADCFVQLR